MKITFITTIYNEQKTIINFLESFYSQSKLPHEIIIVDGGSKDNTVAVIKKFIAKHTSTNISFEIYIKPGNRAVGRNYAISKAKGDIIACSDAGNILDKDWIKNITKPFKNNDVDVVAGYYIGKANTVFQKCVIPYALVMPDQVDPKTFLPATRSISFKKQIWKSIGGFDEKYSHNEDYVFARKLREYEANIVFAKDAVVYWLPRNTLEETYIMMWRFALGDAEAGIFRPKVILLFLRYFLLFIMFATILISMNFIYFSALGVIALLYIIWSIIKNYRYVNDIRAFILLPLIQFTADAAVIFGTCEGLINLVGTNKVFTLYNFLLVLLIVISFITKQKIQNYFHILSLVFVIVPFLFVLLRRDSRIILVKTSLIFILFALIVLSTFKYVRSIFPIPEIADKGIVGYAQYFGYPFSFEPLLFNSMIILPIITFLLFRYFDKRHEK